jgi:cytochrome P450
MRTNTQAGLSPAAVARWQTEIEPPARTAVERLPEGREADLAGDFAFPWSLEAAAVLTRPDSADLINLAALAREISAAAAEPLDAELQSCAAEAKRQLEPSFRNSPFPMASAAFVALSQTLPRFLTCAWLALMRHPDEWRRLHAEPELMPRAMEELLRYAGLARRIFRRAAADIEIAGARIAKDERIILMLARANRDPAEFPEPDRLDLTRHAAGHVAFGAGPHSCVGAPVIRMAAFAATSALTGRFAAAQLARPVTWRGGSGFRSPERLDVSLHHFG